MSEPAPELDAEDALRGVVNQLTLHGERIPVIIPGSVIQTLLFFSQLVEHALDAGYLPPLMRQAMPWTESLTESELDQLAADIAKAAGSGDHAAERLAAVLHEWRETAEILRDPDALAEIRAARAAIARGEGIHGTEAVAALRPRK